MATLRFVLLLALTGCAGSFVLKQPVVSQCESHGLQGCEQITDGVLAYMDGDTEAGRAKLVEGAAKNSPKKVKQFAAGLSALRDVPGMADKMGPIGDIASILAGEPVPMRTPDGSHVVPAAAEIAAASTPRKLIAETTATDDQRQRGCKDRGIDRTCVLARSGGIVVTDIVFDGKCEGAFAAAMPRGIFATSSARWTLRRQVFAGAWTVESDEVFVVGSTVGEKCDVSWAAQVK